MSIPEPEFIIDVYQLNKMLDELGYISPNITRDQRFTLIRRLRTKMYEHLDVNYGIS